jgi:excisionase family DNA binding protein
MLATLSPEVAASLFGLGDEEKPREHLTVNEAAEMLRVVPQTIHHMIRDGRLRAQRVCGKRVLIKREEVLRCFQPIEPQTYEPD